MEERASFVAMMVCTQVDRRGEVDRCRFSNGPQQFQATVGLYECEFTDAKAMGISPGAIITGIFSVRPAVASA